MDGHLDGNALAGPLSELFGFDPTTTTGRCRGCGDVAELARAMVYVLPTALVVRCRGCDNPLLVVMHEPDADRVAFPGLAWIRTARSAG